MAAKRSGEERSVDAEAREADGTRKCKGDVTGEEQEVTREKEERTDIERKGGKEGTKRTDKENGQREQTDKGKR